MGLWCLLQEVRVEVKGSLPCCYSAPLVSTERLRALCHLSRHVILRNFLQDGTETKIVAVPGRSTHHPKNISHPARDRKCLCLLFWPVRVRICTIPVTCKTKGFRGMRRVDREFEQSAPDSLRFLTPCNPQNKAQSDRSHLRLRGGTRIVPVLPLESNGAANEAIFNASLR